MSLNNAYLGASHNQKCQSDHILFKTIAPYVVSILRDRQWSLGLRIILKRAVWNLQEGIICLIINHHPKKIPWTGFKQSLTMLGQKILKSRSIILTNWLRISFRSLKNFLGTVLVLWNLKKLRIKCTNKITYLIKKCSQTKIHMLMSKLCRNIAKAVKKVSTREKGHKIIRPITPIESWNNSILTFPTHTIKWANKFPKSQVRLLLMDYCIELLNKCTQLTKMERLTILQTDKIRKKETL